MQRRNVILISSADGNTMLMCKRRKSPDEGLFSFIGGSVEQEEDGTAAAYRILEAEAGISLKVVQLQHIMDITYYQQDCCLEIYAGRIQGETKVWGMENELLWMGLHEDFYNEEVFAGGGNIWYITEYVKKATDIFK